jgi:cation-transporting ATPase 13A1
MAEENELWIGKTITRLLLLKKVSFWWRADVIFTVLLFSLVASLKLQTNLLESDLSFGLVLGSSATVVVLILLLQYWSVAFRKWVGYSSANYNTATHVMVYPRPHKGNIELLPLQVETNHTKEPIKYFIFQKRRFQYSTVHQRFEKLKYPAEEPLEFYTSNKGLDSVEEMLNRLRIYGENRLEIPVPSFLELYKEQLLAPFFVFQVFCVLLWCLDQYWRYSVMTLGMLLLFEATVANGRRKSLRELRGMRNRPYQLYVYRCRKWEEIPSTKIVPGDIISVTRSAESDLVVPCDSLVLNGSIVADESLLTGESIPVVKDALSLVSEVDPRRPLNMRGEDKNCVIFGGTRPLQVVVSESFPLKAPDNGAICYVLRTGFGSIQGKLMRTILLSTEKVSANTKEAAFLILFLLFFALISSAYVLKNGLETEERSHFELLLHCVLIITSVVPPELPMQLAMAVNSSLVALTKEGIFCTEPYRIPFAGMLDICCFDKTGTITQDNLRLNGFCFPAMWQSEQEKNEEENTRRFSPSPIHMAPLETLVVIGGCHSVSCVDGEWIGDPLETCALKALDCTLSKSNTFSFKYGADFSKKFTIRIVHRHRFSSALQRMSVIAEVETSSKHSEWRVLTKGSPEVIAQLLKEPVDATYHEAYMSLARQGMRVIALAYKTLDRSVSSSVACAMERSKVENNLIFAGFVAFEAPVRKDSKKAVRALKDSSHKVSMITGDSVLTAVHVGRQVEIVERPCLIAQVVPTLSTELEWISAVSGKHKRPYRRGQLESLAEKYDLCISGDAFELAAQIEGDYFYRHLACFCIFARMSPNQKERILTALKDSGYITLMCGDGTNDVGALKHAHVGVALLSVVGNSSAATTTTKTVGKEVNLRRDRRVSKATAAPISSPSVVSNKKNASHPVAASNSKSDWFKKLESLQQESAEDEVPLVKLGDASIASPFTSKNMSIDSCLSIVRQGRCTLATTMQMYQIMSLNCLVSAYSLSVLYLQGVKFGDKQMSTTGFLFAIVFFLISRSKPLKKLSKERPPSSIFSAYMFTSMMGQFMIHTGALVLTNYYGKQYLPKDVDMNIDGSFSPNILNTMVFLVSTAQQVGIFSINYRGYPFMEGLFQRRALWISLAGTFVGMLLAAAEVQPELNAALELVQFPDTKLRMITLHLMIWDNVLAFLLDRLAYKLLR